MENFFEQTVINESLSQPKNGLSLYQNVRKILMVVLLILGLGVFVITFTLLTNLTLLASFLLFAALLILPLLGIYGLISRKIAREMSEYDYLLSGNTFRIVRVYRTRRKVLEISLDAFEGFGTVTDESYARLVKNSQIRHINAYCNADEQTLQYVYFNHNGQKYLLHWEPSVEMMIAIKRSLPRLASQGKFGKTF